MDVGLRIATSICRPGPDTSPGPTAFVEIDFTDDTVTITPSAAVAGLVNATGLRRSTLPGLTVDSTSPGVGAGTAVLAGGGATVAPDGAGTGAGGGGSSAPVQPPVSSTPATLIAATTAFTLKPRWVTALLFIPSRLPTTLVGSVDRVVVEAQHHRRVGPACR